MESRAPVGGGGIRILIPQIIENLSILSGQYNCIYSGYVLYRPDIKNILSEYKIYHQDIKYIVQILSGFYNFPLFTISAFLVRFHD